MRVSFQWLSELAGIEDLTPQEAAQTLTMAGWTVEELRLIDLSQIRVGRIISQEPHPASKKPLWVHMVDLGDEQRQIVAGAANAVVGSLVPVALPGTTVPSGVKVRDANIAGFEARGMLCSQAELELSDEHDGIMLLDSGEPGQPLSAIVPSDAILEVEVTPNRPDCLCHLGLARELAAARGRRLKHDFMPLFTGGIEPPGTDLVSIAIEDPRFCRRYIGAVVSDIRVGPSPQWLQRRLRAVGVRPISNVVDITNYVALEYGQPLHAFDLDRLGARRIGVREAREGEHLLCLDGQDRQLGPDSFVITDGDQPVALAGLIGGAETAVQVGTTQILLEAANFEGIAVRGMSRRLKLRTEASVRLEKNISPELALAGARRAAGLLQEVCGAKVHTSWAEAYPRPQEPVPVRFRPERIDAILGLHVPLEEMEAILDRLGFQVRVETEGEWYVLPPVFRLDVTSVQDVAEEVGRIYGYDNVPATLPGRRRSSWRAATPSVERRLDPCRQALAGAGFDEVVTPALVAAEMLRRLGLDGRALRMVNPLSDDQDTLRTSLLPSLLKVAQLQQKHGRQASRLFEIGRAYLRSRGDSEEPEEQPDEPQLLGVLSTGHEGADAARKAFYELKGGLERAVNALAPARLRFERAEDRLYHPGRTARILSGREAIGCIGELHPTTSQAFGLPGRAVAAQLEIAPLLELDSTRKVKALPRYPAVTRDLAVVVPLDLEAATLAGAIRSKGGELLTDAAAFDDYRGSQVTEGRKSVAFALTFRSPERTLTDEEVDSRLEQIRATLSKRFEASFRD
ncbi:MAG: phenylalanine--tRNA ligase subunit beta [Candidatus Dormibacter sp.]|uniref:phenylalanine--tRNA ligase subunit beta n=1 Tax=Candidatus Dormibacter sp. TaxID=2973982 RepID=UPI000DB5FC40|nr:MAG: phenylalanine--tRNA ligase subunit beta [Candidatus Dormibacteraeota bacterium]